MIAAACGRVNRAQPSALCQSLPSLSCLFLSESLSFCASGAASCSFHLCLSSLPLHSLWVCPCASYWKTFPDKYPHPHCPTAATHPPTADCVCLNANQFLWNFHWPIYGFRATAPSSKVLYLPSLVLSSFTCHSSCFLSIFPFLILHLTFCPCLSSSYFPSPFLFCHSIVIPFPFLSSLHFFLLLFTLVFSSFSLFVLSSVLQLLFSPVLHSFVTLSFILFFFPLSFRSPQSLYPGSTFLYTILTFFSPLLLTGENLHAHRVKRRHNPLPLSHTLSPARGIQM